MALVMCKGCGNQVSTTASECPRCGTPPAQTSPPSQSPDPSKHGTGINWMRLGILGVCLIVAAIAGGYAYTKIGNVLTNRRIHHLVSNHQYGEARQAIDSNLRGHPKNAQMWVLAGETALQTGDLTRAQTAFNRAFSLDPATGSKIGSDYFATGRQDLESNSAGAGNMLTLAANYDPTLGPKIAKLYFDKGQLAAKLHNVNSMEALFEKAMSFDRSFQGQVAEQFTAAMSQALDRHAFDEAQRYAKDAVAANPATASKEAQALFGKVAASFCDLQAVTRTNFDRRMKLVNELGLSDSVKGGIPYRFAYALELYNTASRPQAIDIFNDVASDGSNDCARAVAKYILAPPPPGQIPIALSPKTVVETGTIQLLYVDIRPHAIKLTFSIRNTNQGSIIIPFAKPSNKHTHPLLYIEDDNGQVFNTTTGWMGGRQQSLGNAWSVVRLAGGEAVELSAKFPMVSRGSQTFSFVSPRVQVGWGTVEQEWGWPDIRFKRGVFKAPPSTAVAAASASSR